MSSSSSSLAAAPVLTPTREILKDVYAKIINDEDITYDLSTIQGLLLRVPETRINPGLLYYAITLYILYGTFTLSEIKKIITVLIQKYNVNVLEKGHFVFDKDILIQNFVEFFLNQNMSMEFNAAIFTRYCKILYAILNNETFNSNLKLNNIPPPHQIRTRLKDFPLFIHFIYDLIKHFPTEETNDAKLRQCYERSADMIALILWKTKIENPELPEKYYRDMIERLSYFFKTDESDAFEDEYDFYHPAQILKRVLDRIYNPKNYESVSEDTRRRLDLQLVMNYQYPKTARSIIEPSPDVAQILTPVEFGSLLNEKNAYNTGKLEEYIRADDAGKLAMIRQAYKLKGPFWKMDVRDMTDAELAREEERERLRQSFIPSIESDNTGSIKTAIIREDARTRGLRVADRLVWQPSVGEKRPRDDSSSSSSSSSFERMFMMFFC